VGACAGALATAVGAAEDCTAGPDETAEEAGAGAVATAEGAAEGCTAGPESETSDGVCAGALAWCSAVAGVAEGSAGAGAGLC